MKGFFSLLSQNTFLRNSIVLFSGTMVVNVLNYIFHLVIGRMVTPSMYGEIESLISLLTIISVPAGTLTLIATKYAAEMKAKEDVPGTKALSQYLNHKILFYGLPLFFLALFLTPLVKQFLHTDTSLPIIFLWGVMFLSFLSAVIVGLLTGWQRFADVNKISISSTVVKFFAALLFVKVGFGVSGVVGSFILAALISYGIAWFLLKKMVRGVSAETVRASAEKMVWGQSLRGYVLPAFYGTLSVAILGNADMVFAKHHLEASLSGEYGALSVVAKTIFFVTGVLTTVLFAMSAEETGRSGSEAATRTFRLAAFLTGLVSLSSVVIFSFFPALVLGALFGEKYVAASPLLGWFALAAGIYSLANLFMQYLLSLHETRVTQYLLALSGLEILTLFFFGETLYAIIGITIVTQILATVLGLAFILKRK